MKIVFAVIFAVSILNADVALATLTADDAMQVYHLYEHVHSTKNPTSTMGSQPHETESEPELGGEPPVLAVVGSIVPEVEIQNFHILQPITIEPESEYKWCPKGKPCSLFVEKNMQQALYATQLMLDAPDFQSFIDLSTQLRDQISEEIYLFSFTAALIYREDTQGILIPPIEEVNPYWFVSGPAIEQAEQYYTQNSTDNDTIIVDYLYENGTESCLAYFREDISVNSHHWSWHTLQRASSAIGPVKERIGELFIFLHQQILARYDAERFTCGLPRVLPLPDFDTPIPESYFPHLLTSVSGNAYTGRGPNLSLQDMPNSGIFLSQLDTYYKRVLNASASRMYQLLNGTYTNLPNINILAAITEANASPNTAYYGSIHNSMHNALSLIGNDDGQNAARGVMGYPSAAMRDPVFYRWHKNVDDICDIYTAKSTQYSSKDLQLENIVISSIYVQGNSSIGILETFTQQRLVNISKGIDFSGNNAVLVRVKHLQHEDFTHNIVVENKAQEAQNITIRIYIAPKTDHLNNAIPFSEQRRMFIFLDRFTALVKPGIQTITRKSGDSSVTIPTQLNFEQLELQATQADSPSTNFEVPTRCICGWPDTHLIPRGTVNGTTYDYFVMATDGADYQEPTSEYCTSAPVYCGLWKAAYPDRKNMGYPFDREAPKSIKTIAQFASYANMRAHEIVIKHLPNKLVTEHGAVISSGPAQEL